jgi:hypothetical protein
LFVVWVLFFVICLLNDTNAETGQAMIPPSILDNLAGLRRRERLLDLVWGLARWFAVLIGLLLVGGLVDYLVDRQRDTPFTLRVVVFAVQAAVAVGTLISFVVWPQLRRRPDPDLALYVEEKVPSLGHRLISAVQLNRPGAFTQGMSHELIALVTIDAETRAREMSFAKLADHRRLRWSAMALLPALLLAAVPLLAFGDLAMTLLARQGLFDVEIPRSITLENITRDVWPNGDKVQVRYKVTGPAAGDDLVGSVYVLHQDGDSGDAAAPGFWSRLADRLTGSSWERYSLEFIEKNAAGELVYGVDLPPGSRNLLHAARLADGRTRAAHQVRYVPRPVVTDQQAWVQLPKFCGVRPDGSRYEVPQGRGDVVGIAGSNVRIALKSQKAIRKATVELWGAANFDPKGSDELLIADKLLRRVPMTVKDDGLEAEAIVELKRDEIQYRLVVEDEYGFANDTPPRRTMRVVPEEAPQVALLRDYLGSDTDSELLDGIPVTPDSFIRIPYVAHGNYGLGHARLLYRVMKKRESGNEEEDPKALIVTELPLSEVIPNAKSGAFDPKIGTFANSPADVEVPFHAVPSANPEFFLGRTLGGGRFSLKLKKGLIDGSGKPVTVKAGDQIEYAIKVFADKNPNSGRPWAISDTRVAVVVDDAEFSNWLTRTLAERERLQELRKKQGSLFDQ